jgi:hypothetical protein
MTWEVTSRTRSILSIVYKGSAGMPAGCCEKHFRHRAREPDQISRNMQVRCLYISSGGLHNFIAISTISLSLGMHPRRPLQPSSSY